MPDSQRMEIQSWDEGTGRMTAHLTFPNEKVRKTVETKVAKMLGEIEDEHPGTEIFFSSH